jgi:hypothetical protein
MRYVLINSLNLGSAVGVPISLDRGKWIVVSSQVTERYGLIWDGVARANLILSSLGEFGAI